jgi:predicted transcriptional regulator
MRTTRNGSILAGALALALAGSTAAAVPATNAPLPTFGIDDVTGQQHNATELRGRPTMLVVLTSPHAGDPTRVWMREATRRLQGSNVKIVTVVSIDLAPIIPTAFVRMRAREQTPAHALHTTWLDRNGSVRRTLGLPKDHQPYIFALDAEGRVLSMAHGVYEARAAEQVFSHLAAR